MGHSGTYLNLAAVPDRATGRVLLFAVVFGLGQLELMLLEPEAIDSKGHR
jgi:hypothetical protein